MNQLGQNQESPGRVIVAIRWPLRLFFSLWTTIVLVFVGWLMSSHSSGNDLLIAIGPHSTSSSIGRMREWVVGHVAVEWAYPWVLLAPYVIWFGFKVAAIRRGMAWWLMMQMMAGAAFVIASQSIMQRIELHRPRSIWIQRDAIVHKFGPGATNETNSLQIARSISWPDGETRVVAHVGKGEVTAQNLGSNGLSSTNIEWQSDNGEARVMVIRRDYSFTNTIGDERGSRVEDNAGFHARPSDLASNLVSVIEAQLNSLPIPPHPGGPRKFSATLDALAYAALIGLTQAVHFRRRLVEREKQAMHLESQLAQSQLRTLQAQLQPHFLFNTLNGIAMLIRRDPRLAEDMIGSLSELLRWSLQQSGRQLIPLRDEMEFLDRYLEIQQMRFADRLRVDRRIEPGVLDCLVPPLLLQPLVENAVRHGIEPSPNPGLIVITAGVVDGLLFLAVEDDGVGMGGTATRGGGLGIASVKERLAGLYGGEHTFTMENRPTGGVVVQVRIPLRSVS